jgi:hypothetical protein
MRFLLLHGDPPACTNPDDGAIRGDLRAGDPPRFLLDQGDRHLLTGWVRAGRTPQRLVTRARIVLLSADGWPAAQISREVGVNLRTVHLWRRRFVVGGPEALRQDAPGRGRKPKVSAGDRRAIVELLGSASVSWSIRSVAEKLGLPRSTVHAVWKGYKKAEGRK